MTVNKGFELVLQIETSTNVWESIPGERVSGYTIGNESVDTTAKQQTSRELSACGVKTVNITASGIIKDDLTKTLWNTLNQLAFAGGIAKFRVVSKFLIPISGLFLVSSFGRTGEYNGAEQWSLTLESTEALEVDGVMSLPPLPVTPSYVSMWYSLRRMVAGYSGPCLRVRRASDNAEQDIAFTISGMIDEAALVSFCAGTDGFVVRWYNQSPYPTNQEYVGNAAANAQPKIVINGVMTRNSAGKPGIRCDTGKELFQSYSVGLINWTEQHCFCGIVLERDSGQNQSNANMYGVGMGTISGSSYNCLFTGCNDGSVFYIWGLPNRPTANPKAWQWTPDPKHFYICAASNLDFVNRNKGSVTPHEEVYQTISPSVVPAVSNISVISVPCFHPWQIDFLQGWLSEVVLQSDPVYGWTHDQMNIYYANASTFWEVPSW